MPLARYFLYVGGVLLALLIIADAYLPKSPIAEASGPRLPVIRLYSERRGPERVIYDTSISAPIGNAASSIPSSAAVANVSTRVQEAFAQMLPSDPDRTRGSDPKKPEPKLRQPRKFAKRHAAPFVRLVARQSQFGWSGPRIW
jgi:hypothetical protein